MAYEIDFLPVGNGDRSGDAIALRWWDGSAFKVMVYDGGTKDSGQTLVNHIQQHYGTKRVDYVVNSHPDADHASGLSVVMEQLEVGEVWMHRPWAHSSVICDYFKDGRITDNSLADRLKEKMAAAYAVEQLAVARGIPVKEPFQGAYIGPFLVLSPSRDWYIHDLVPAFAKSPEQKTVAEDSASMILSAIAGVVRSALDWIDEEWNVETLRENVTTSAENDSSVILLGVLADKGILLCGDAGVQALDRATDYCDYLGTHLPTLLNFVQVPHHGSRNNVSSSVLDKILGPKKLVDDGQHSKTAFVSASANSKTHPRQVVINAFVRRGVNVVPTKDSTKNHRYNLPVREGWSTVEGLKYSPQVESWE